MSVTNDDHTPESAAAATSADGAAEAGASAVADATASTAAAVQEETDAAGAALSERDLPDELQLTVRRQVNLPLFIGIGVVVGVIAAIISAYSFPPPEPLYQGYQVHTPQQALGFFLVFMTALSVVIFAAIGLIINAILGRKRGKVTVRRVPAAADSSASSADAGAAAADSSAAGSAN